MLTGVQVASVQCAGAILGDIFRFDLTIALTEASQHERADSGQFGVAVATREVRHALVRTGGERRMAFEQGRYQVSAGRVVDGFQSGQTACR